MTRNPELIKGLTSYLNHHDLVIDFSKPASFTYKGGEPTPVTTKAPRRINGPAGYALTTLWSIAKQLKLPLFFKINDESNIHGSVLEINLSKPTYYGSVQPIVSVYNNKTINTYSAAKFLKQAELTTNSAPEIVEYIPPMDHYGMVIEIGDIVVDFSGNAVGVVVDWDPLYMVLTIDPGVRKVYVTTLGKTIINLSKIDVKKVSQKIMLAKLKSR